MTASHFIVFGVAIAALVMGYWPGERARPSPFLVRFWAARSPAPLDRRPVTPKGAGSRRTNPQNISRPNIFLSSIGSRVFRPGVLPQVTSGAAIAFFSCHPPLPPVADGQETNEIVDAGGGELSARPTEHCHYDARR